MTEARANSHPSPRKVSRTVLGYVLFATAFLAVGLYILFISGPAMHAAARERLAQTIAEEDRSFCEQFGARSGSAGFARAAENWQWFGNVRPSATTPQL